MNQLKILHTVGGLNSSSGGPARTVSRLCEGIGRKGGFVTVFTQRFKQDDICILPNPEMVHTEFIQAVSIPQVRISYSPFFYPQILRHCRKQKIMLIHDHGVWLSANHAAASAARRLNIPLIINPRGMLEPWAIQFKAWKKYFAWKLYQNRDLHTAALFCATAEQEYENIRKLGFKQPIAVIPNGVDLPKWQRPSCSQSKIHTALFLSRVHPKKGLLNLVKAWTMVKPENWQVIIAGPDENGHLKEVETAVLKAGLQAVFKFAGSVEGKEKSDLYLKSDLFILPTFSENFGVVVAEALSYGVPVITTKGTPWEGLTTHKCGWWIDIGAESLAEAVQQAVLLTDEQRFEMGKQGRKYVERSFGWEKIAEDMISVYQWVLKQGAKPDCVRLD
ncbi:glycosyltransferase [Desulfonema limicola]|nr:glycosyltransferase [Desulfonema limicola]